VLRLVPPEARANAPTLMSSAADGVDGVVHHGGRERLAHRGGRERLAHRERRDRSCDNVGTRPEEIAKKPELNPMDPATWLSLLASTALSPNGRPALQASPLPVPYTTLPGPTLYGTP
jgi:hypothetical protein